MSDCFSLPMSVHGHLFINLNGKINSILYTSSAPSVLAEQCGPLLLPFWGSNKNSLIYSEEEVSKVCNNLNGNVLPFNVVLHMLMFNYLFINFWGCIELFHRNYHSQAC